MWAGPDDDDERRGGRLRRYFLPAAIAIIVAAAAGGFAWGMLRGGDDPEGTTSVSAPTATAGESGAPSAEPTGGSEPTAEESQDPGTSDEGAVQAEAVDAILSDSRGARSGLAPALTSLRACEETEDSVATVQRVTQARRDQVERAQGLAVDAMSEGDQVKNLLMTALKASLDADEHFLTWAQRRSGDCESDWSDDPDYNQGLSFSTKATAAKKQFVEAWNPLAEELGLSTRAPHEI